MKTKLLTSNTKIDKSMKLYPEYEASILQMLPGKGVCVNYKNCIKECLAFTGFSKVYKTVNQARQRRKDLFTDNLELFKKQLVKEIRNQVKRAIKKGRKAVIRLNGFTDIDWNKPEYYIEGFTVFELFPEVIFYDYTADANKVINNEHSNYHLTFSYKGNNEHEAKALFSEFGINTAVIDLPENNQFKSIRSIQGDTHDFRFLDNPASIVWLTFKN